MSTTPTNRWSLFELSATYYQDSDCNDLGEPGQELKITAESNGSGSFLTLSSTRWAISGPTELQALLADFIGRGKGLPLEAVTAPARPKPAYYPQLCNKCGAEGNIFDNCAQPGCAGCYLVELPAPAGIDLQDPDPVRGNMQARENAVLYGPHKAHEYGFGKPAGPYPVEAIDMSKVQVTKHVPLAKLDFPDNCPYCQGVGELFTNCENPSCQGLPEAWHGATAPVVPAPAPEPTPFTQKAINAGTTPLVVDVVDRRPLPNAWTAADIQTLKELWADTNAAAIGGVLGRTAKAVMLKGNALKLKKGPVEPAAAPVKQPAKPTLLPMPAKAVGKKPVNHMPDSAGINAGLESKLLKLVDRLGNMKLFKMDEHEAKQALQLLTNNVDKLAWVPGAERLRERLAGCYALPTNGVTMEGSRASA